MLVYENFLMKQTACVLSPKFLSLRYFILWSEWSVEEFEDLIHKVEHCFFLFLYFYKSMGTQLAIQFFDLQTFKDVISIDLAMASNLDSSTSKRRLNRGFAFVQFSSHGVSICSLFCARKFIFG